METDAHPHHLFVYGTLRSGARGPMQSRLMQGMRLAGRASIPGRIYDTGRYPVATEAADDGDRIIGELFAFDADLAGAQLAALDEYEGIDTAHPARSLFRRLVVMAEGEGGMRVPAWVYFYNGPVDALPRVASGDWLRR